jgi:hypothetical protein
MMNHAETFPLLNDYVDGDLTLQQQIELEAHLRACMECQAQVRQLRSLLFEAAKLPRSIEPLHDLWPEVKVRITRQAPILPMRPIKARLSGWTQHITTAAAILLVAVGSFYLSSRPSASWRVVALQGTPRIASTEIMEQGMIRPGQILETDAVSRARIAVGSIGQVEVGPQTRIKLLEARQRIHRFALNVGTIHARINAPPRIFIVETPSATAVDLGCEYTLLVAENGSGILRVTSGWVSLELDGRRSVIPAGAQCETRPGIGPGTPVRHNASGPFQRAIREFDFDSGGSGALNRILSEARPTDALSLWHLIPRVTGDDRERVINALRKLVPPPNTATQEGLLRGDEQMMREWFDSFGVRGPWWNIWQ